LPSEHDGFGAKLSKLRKFIIILKKIKYDFKVGKWQTKKIKLGLLKGDNLKVF
jgi:hypothetical protein